MDIDTCHRYRTRFRIFVYWHDGKVMALTKCNRRACYAGDSESPKQYKFGKAFGFPN